MQPVGLTLADVRSVLPGARPTTAALFLVLWSARGRFVGYESVAAGLRDYLAEYPTQEAIRSMLKRIRLGIRKSGIPVEIETACGIGLRLTVLEPGWIFTDQKVGG